MNPVSNIREHEARLNITYKGQNGDLLAPVPFNASEKDLRDWAAEAISGGGVPGIHPDRRANLTEHVIDRFTVDGKRQHNVIFLRPSTPFG